MPRVNSGRCRSPVISTRALLPSRRDTETRRRRKSQGSPVPVSAFSATPREILPGAWCRRRGGAYCRRMVVRSDSQIMSRLLAEATLRGRAVLLNRTGGLVRGSTHLRISAWPSAKVMPAGAVVVARRVIDDLRGGRAFHHLVGEPAGIDAVGMFVEEDVELGRAGSPEIGGFEEHLVLGLGVVHCTAGRASAPGPPMA
jgi:hypothetical protein